MRRETVFVMLVALAPVMASATSESGVIRGEGRSANPEAAFGRYGIIESIESSQGGNDLDRIGATVIGGVLGGIAARPVGSDCADDSAPAFSKVADAPIRSKAGVSERRQGAYFIRIRLDDRSYQTVAQIGLDGLRVGDSVRIGRGRVRRCDAFPSQAELPADTAGR